MDHISAIARSHGADETVARVVPWFFVWHAQYWVARAVSPLLFSTYKKLEPEMKAYWAASIVSTVHAVYIVYIAVIAIETVDIRTSTNVNITSPESTQANIVFIAYLCSDLVLALFYNAAWPGWQSNMIHHTTGIICWYLMNQGGFGHCLALCAMITETTTPFVNQRFFFDRAGMKAGSLYVVNGLLMTLLWFILRVCLFGWLGWRMITAMRASILALPPLYFATAVFSYVVGYSLQLFWFSKIFKGALKHLSPPKARTA